MLLSLVISLVFTCILIQVAVFSTTIYLHRAATHRAIVLHRAVEVPFRAALWITTGIVPRQWVAVHRKHHAFTDEDGDPHSPLLAGFWSVQLGNIFHYVRESRNLEVVEKYAHDIEPDAWDRALFGHSGWGPVGGTIVMCALFAAVLPVAWPIGVGLGLMAGTIHAVMYVFVLSPSINGLCHFAGYKNFDNTATNIRALALLTGGEGLHNNHHGFPRSPKFSCRASEFDPAWPVIKLLTMLKLAQPYKTIEQTQS